MSLPETYKAIIANEKGEISVKEFPLPKPSTNQVLVKVEFAPLNPTDFMKINGFYGKPADYETALHGSEGSGVVVAVGSDLKSPFQIGDRVHIWAESWGQYVLTESDNLSEDAASHWINPATVYYMGVLADRGDHKAAIHTAGSSALGRMLIKYFKAKNIKLINIVRKQEFVEELKREGADYVLNSQAPDFEDRLKELVEKENATLAFDAIGGDFTNKILKAQPVDSEVLVYGTLAGFQVKSIDIQELFKGKRVGSLFMPTYAEQLKKKGEFEKFTDDVHGLLPTLLGSSVQKVFKIDDHMGIAISGLTSDARVLARYMQNECLNHKYVFDAPMQVGRLVTQISDKAQVYTQKSEKRPYGVGLLVAGYDKTGPHLYQTLPSGNFFEYKAQAMGARSQGAKTYLEKFYTTFENLSLDDLIRQALIALKSTSDKPLTAKNVTVGFVGRDTPFTQLDDDNVARYVDAVADNEDDERKQAAIEAGKTPTPAATATTAAGTASGTATTGAGASAMDASEDADRSEDM